MQRDGNPILKFICYGLLTVLTYLIETGTPAVHAEVLGVGIDVLPCLPAAAALFEGPGVGAAVGLLTGMLYDLGGNGIEGLLPLYYMLFAAAAGVISGRWMRRIWPSHLLLTAGGMLVLRLLEFGLAAIIGEPFPALAFFQTMYAQILVALIFSPLPYLPCLLVTHCLNRRREKPPAIP